MTSRLHNLISGLFLGLLALLVSAPSHVSAAAPVPRPGRPPPIVQQPARQIVGRIAPLEGGFFVRLGGWSRWQFFRSPISLGAGDEIRVPDGFRAELQLPDRTRLRTRGETLMMVRTPELLIDRGALDVMADEPIRPVRILTPAGAVAAPRARFSLQISVGRHDVEVRILSGVVSAQALVGNREILGGTGRVIHMVPGRAPVLTGERVAVGREMERFASAGRVPDRSPLPPGVAPLHAMGAPPAGSTVGPNPEAAGGGESHDKPPRTLKPGALRLSLRDRMRSLRSSDERCRRYRSGLAERATDERKNLQRGLELSGSEPTLLQERALARKVWTEKRRRINQRTGLRLVRAGWSRSRFSPGETRDGIIQDRRRELLGRDLWLQTREGVAETRRAISTIEASLTGLNNQITGLPAGGANANRLAELQQQRDSLLSRADDLEDRIEELIEIQ